MSTLKDIKKNFLSVPREEALSVIEGIRASRLISKKSTKSKSLKQKITKKFEIEDMLDKLTPEQAEMILEKMDKGEL